MPRKTRVADRAKPADKRAPLDATVPSGGLGAEHPKALQHIGILERVSDGFVAFDAQMNYTYVNRKGAELLGRKPEDLIGRNYWVEHPGAKGTPFADAYVRALEAQEMIILEDYYRPWDRWFENRIYPSRDGLSIFFTEITERKRAEEFLKESEGKFKDVFEAANVGKSITSPDGKISVNKAFADMLGYSREELANKTWQELTPHDEIDLIQAILSPLLNGEMDSIRFTKRYVHKDGSFVWTDVSTVMRRDEDGKPRYFITTMVDISERKRAEDQLRLSEERFSSAFHTSPAGMTITRTADGKFVDANEAFCRMFEYSREEVIGHTSTELNMWTPEERKKLIDEQLRSGGLQNFELEARAKSGRSVNILFSSKPMELEGELHHITTMIDITERKQSEKALQDQLRLTTAITDTSPALIYLYDMETQSNIYSNQGIERLLGYSSDELKEMGAELFPRLIHPGDMSDVIAFQSQILNAADEEILELEYRMKDHQGGWRWLRSYERPFWRNDDGSVKQKIGIAIDITERKRAESERERLLNVLEASLNEIYIFESDTLKFRYVNQGAIRNLGYTFEQLTEMTPLDLKPEFTEDSFREMNRPLLRREKERHVFQTVHRRGDGSLYFVEVHLQLVESAGEQLFLAVILDITERKIVEKKLFESESRLRLFIQHAPMAIAMFDREMRYIATSQRWLTYFQLGDMNIIGACHYDIFPNLPQTHKDAHQRCLNGEIEKHDEDLIVLEDGTPEWSRWELHPWHDSQGQIGGLIFFIESITERKKAEQELRNSEERFRRAVEHAPIPIQIHAEDGVVIAVNDEWLRQSGYAREEISKIADWVENAYRERKEQVKSDIDQLYSLDAPLDEGEAEIQTKGVEMRVWHFHSAPLGRMPDGRRIVISMAVDVTERRRAEEELRLSRDRLAELSRRLVEVHETESRAIGRELHDQIGQMLTALKLTLELIPQLPAKLAEKKLIGATELVDDLMARISRLSLELRPPMLDDLGLLPALLWHINRYEEQTSIEVEFKHSGLEGKRFDRELETTVYRLTQESLTNVARHAHATRLRLEVRTERDEMKIRIEDDGAGFDPQIAFAKNRGLSGMRERVNLLDGSFQIESQIGKGARILIRLPLR